jgi:hypothetical protein
LTKAHEEQASPLLGIANSAKMYGYNDPAVVFSDDPVKSVLIHSDITQV